MTDVHSKETRSYNMSRIRAKDTKPEILVRKFLFSKGLRYRVNDEKLPGKPDIVLPKYKIVIFIHGCFWHGHEGCKYYVVPKTRTEWWLSKINTNKNNDAKAVCKLKIAGWNIIIVWECDLKSDRQEKTLNDLYQKIINLKLIPIIDIFAGPGGLGEGFSSLLNENDERMYKIRLSIEKDSHAYQTLKLRSFFRQFPAGKVPEDYYLFVREKITINELYKKHPLEAALASEEACCGTLGEPDEGDTNGLTNEEVDVMIKSALNENPNWLLIGGPPCQAYSLVGRSRRQEKKLDEAKDKRVGLYKEYLRIIAVHKPAVFVMENVKGLLSAQTEDEFIFHKILNDLSDPVTACISEGEIAEENVPLTKYKIHSLTTYPRGFDIYEAPIFKPTDFIIRAEEYGIPQRRHRVILLGVREDIEAKTTILTRQKEVSLSSVISNLPSIRSGITKSFSHTTTETDIDGKPKKKRHYNKLQDSFDTWKSHIGLFNNQIAPLFEYPVISTAELPETMGTEFKAIKRSRLIAAHPLREWYYDERLGGVLHHVSRMHLLEDIKRYLFASRYVQQHGNFPRLEDYKKAGDDLMPDHENADSGKFTDRFRVQLPNIPATTITSHISKDGHYFIHYDPNQCRSFTVREAARVQTFPDNYYFCGGRTQQFHQVGNAVPPYLAYQIAEIVAAIFSSIPNLNVHVNETVKEI
jgi:DNA (cytosine-5)-methyltransferase 1